jgi:hypothetical protein
MHHINSTRVILGGLLAGLILNIGDFILNSFVVADASAAALQRLGLAQPGAAQTVVFAILNFALGIVLVWLYAAIRPRFGAGVQTAVWAGCAGWVLCLLFPTFWFLILGMFPLGMMLISLVWALVEVLLATGVGAWVYQEEAMAPAPAT